LVFIFKNLENSVFFLKKKKLTLEDDKAYVVNENHEWFRNRLALGRRSKHSHIEWCSSRGGAMGYFALGLEIAPPRGDKSRGTWVDFEMDSEYCGQLINDCSFMRVDESLVYRPSRLCELVRECSSQVCIRHTFQEENQRVNWVLFSRNHCKVEYKWPKI
jgi:hypothetical protein